MRTGAIFSATLFALAAFAPQTPTRAECAQDIQRLVDKRDALMSKIGPIPSEGEENRLDPAAACPNLRQLVGALDETVAWFAQNKQQCGIVDAVVDSIAGQRARIAALTGQLCRGRPAAPKPRAKR
ncbi:MAG: hypothetical protein KGM42_17800 [Hyphomicrobiales bacterium]|nr:hypothetical protein [Hyphomicrobiales bacterium]